VTGAEALLDEGVVLKGQESSNEVVRVGNGVDIDGHMVGRLGVGNL